MRRWLGRIVCRRLWFLCPNCGAELYPGFGYVPGPFERDAL